MPESRIPLETQLHNWQKMHPNDGTIAWAIARLEAMSAMLGFENKED